jgi:hypothetical protein
MATTTKTKASTKASGTALKAKAAKGAGPKASKPAKTAKAPAAPAPTKVGALSKKLGITPGQTVVLIDAPESFPPKLEPLPDGVELRHSAMRGAGFDLAILFVPNQNTLQRRFSQLAKLMRPKGSLWVAWPGKNSGFHCDVTADGAKAVAIKDTLVDAQTVDFDPIWTGMRFVLKTEVLTEIK